ncbi:MAG: restriction endonuclease [Candidatus Accumulibacter necessarius]|jgi:restriction system protein|uniref:restriction endonuclease n=1 Tax=Candidatus Accumulibacter necessarius TaxID=2954386 RepID=UPI002FC2CE02
MTDFQQIIVDILQEQHSHLASTKQARLERSRSELTTSIRAWKNYTGRPCGYESQDERISNLAARLDALPDKASIAPLDTQFFIARLSEIDDAIAKYREVLSIKRRQTEFLGDYGNVDNEKWIKEIIRFIQRNPTVDQAVRSLEVATKEAELNVNWRSAVAEHINEQIAPATALLDVEPADGVAFEHACLLVLQKSGWSARLTPPTGDQGVDILAKKNGVSVAIQCKNHRAPVGNAAIQEVYAGKSFYEADVAVAVSLSSYTPSGSLLAKKLGVLLLDQVSLNRLEELILAR